jgi:hypothetical protein
MVGAFNLLVLTLVAVPQNFETNAARLWQRGCPNYTVACL